MGADVVFWGDRLYLFLMQMIQIPLIAMGRMPVVQRNKNIGNIVFW